MGKALVFNQVNHPATAALEHMLSRNARSYLQNISHLFEEALLETRQV